MPRLSELTNKWLAAAFAYQGIDQEVDKDCQTMCGSPISDDLKGIFNRLDEANSIGAMYCAESFGLVTIRITLQKTVREERGVRVTHIQRLPDTNRLRVCYVLNSINDRAYGVTFCREQSSGLLYMEKHVQLTGNAVEDGLRLHKDYWHAASSFLTWMPVVCMAHDKERYSLQALDSFVADASDTFPGLTQEYDLFMTPIGSSNKNKLGRKELMDLLNPSEPPKDTQQDKPGDSDKTDDDTPADTETT